MVTYRLLMLREAELITSCVVCDRGLPLSPAAVSFSLIHSTYSSVNDKMTVLSYHLIWQYIYQTSDINLILIITTAHGEIECHNTSYLTWLTIVIAANSFHHDISVKVWVSVSQMFMFSV